MGKPAKPGKKDTTPVENEVLPVQEPRLRNLMFIKRFGKYGEEPGNFRYPSDAVMLPGNAILVTDSWNNRIQVLELNLETGESKVLDSYTFPGNMEPTGITKFNNRIFICCNGFGATSHGIQEFGWSGIDPSKPVIVKKEKVETGKTKKGDNKKSTKVTPEPQTEDVIEAPKPKLWPLHFFGNKIGNGDQEFAYPTSIAAHEPSGTLLVVDSGNFRMVVLKPGAKIGDKTTWVKSWNHEEGEEGFGAPHTVSTDKDGFVYITDKATNRVYLYYHDKNSNTFKFLTVLIGPSEGNEGGGDMGEGREEGTTIAAVVKPFPQYCLGINLPWSVKVNTVCGMSEAEVINAATSAANAAAAAAAHVGENDLKPKNQLIPVSTMITLSDKASHCIHSFMVNITPNELLLKKKEPSENGLDEEAGGTSNTLDEMSINNNQIQKKQGNGPYADYTVTAYHLSSYGIDAGEEGGGSRNGGGGGNNDGTLDIPTSSCILRSLEKFPVKNPNPASKRPSTNDGGDDVEGGEEGEPSSAVPQVVSPDDHDLTPDYSEYVLVVDSHNHSIVALGVNVP